MTGLVGPNTWMLEKNDKLNAARVTLLNAGRTQDAVLPEFIRTFTQDRTFQTLAAGLGDENAKGVVVGIGQVALASSPDLNVGDLGAIVTQTLAKLTKQDLAGLAKNDSSALGRVQSIVQEEIKAQRNNAPINQDSTANQASHAADFAGATVLNGNRDGGRRFSDIRDKSASDAATFAREIGIKPGDASLFVGAGVHVQNAIRNFLKDGSAITENDVKTLGDAKAVIGLIRSGKINADDPRVPQSVKSVIDEMKKDGIDLKNAKPDEINKWMDAHPAALEEAKKKIQADIKARQTQSDDQKLQAISQATVKVEPSGAKKTEVKLTP